LKCAIRGYDEGIEEVRAEVNLELKMYSKYGRSSTPDILELEDVGGIFIVTL
jgi:hypothetical protein